MADIAFDPAADQQPNPDFSASALQGIQLGQAARANRALQGINLDDPDSLNRGMGNWCGPGRPIWPKLW